MSKIMQAVQEEIDKELCSVNGGGFTNDTLWSATMDTRYAAAKRVLASKMWLLTETGKNWDADRRNLIRDLHEVAGERDELHKELQWVLDHAKDFVCRHVRAVLQPNSAVNGGVSPSGSLLG